MKVFLVGILTVSLAVAGDCRIVNQPQVVYPNALAVGAIPLNQAYLLDTAAYQYRVNPSFSSHQEYLSGKSKAVAKAKGSLSTDDHRAIALEVLNLMREQGIVTGGEPVQSKPAEVVNPAVKLLVSKCASCHSAYTADGGFVITEGSGLLSLPPWKWEKVRNYINRDDDLRMPRGPNKFSEEELNIVNAWLKGKVPQKPADKESVR